MKKMTRREWLKRAGLAAAGGGFGYVRFVEPKWLSIKTYRLKSAQLNGKFSNPIKIAIIADPHVGCPAVGLKQLESIVQTVNELKPDVVLGVGDFLNTESAESIRPEFRQYRKWYKNIIYNGDYVEPEEIAPVFAKLNAEHVFAGLGNHDFYHDHERLVAAFEKTGNVGVLNNQVATVQIQNECLDIAGVSDSTTWQLRIIRLLFAMLNVMLLKQELRPCLQLRDTRMAANVGCLGGIP